MPFVDPRGWAFLSFGDENAWTDFLGSHALWHIAFDRVVRGLGAGAYAVLPLGDGGGAEWDEAHQLVHNGVAAALGLTAAPDFRSYDRSDADQFATFSFLHAQEHVRLREAAGV